MLPIQAGEQVELTALLSGAHAGTAEQVVDRRSLRIEGRPLIDAWEEACPPVLRVVFWQAAAEGVVHHDVAGQVLVLGAQAVRHPRADRREAHARQTAVDLE